MSKYELNQDYSMKIGEEVCQVKLVEIKTSSFFPTDYSFEYLPGSPRPLINEALKEFNLKGDFNLPEAFLELSQISKLNPGPETEESEYSARLEKYLKKEFVGHEREARSIFMKMPKEYVIEKHLKPNNY